MKKQITIDQPLISVIMPVYNAEAYVSAALDSIFSQTYQNFEVIVIDDASTDNSPTILNSYKKRFPKKLTVVHMLKNLNRGGDSCANEALKYAKGLYIARMDADDIAHPKRFEKQVQFLNTHPELTLVGSNAYVIDAAGKRIGEKCEPLSSSEIRKSYMRFHPLIHPSCMIRRVIDGKPFTYKLKYSANNDYYTFFSLICEGKQFANLNEKLLYYRIHGKNDTFVHMRKKYMNTLKIRLEMIIKNGYRPTLSDLLYSLIQSAVVFIFPEKLLTTLYFFYKGISKPKLSFVPSFLSPKVSPVSA